MTNEEFIIIATNCIDIAHFAARQIILSFFEILKTAYGQSNQRTILDIIYYFFFLLITNLKSNDGIDFSGELDTFQFKINIKADLSFFSILALDIIELISWTFMKTGFNAQALNAVNIKMIVTQNPDFIPYAIMCILFCLFIIFFPFYQKLIQLPKIENLVSILHFVLLFMFILTILHDFRDTNNRILFDDADNIYFTYLKQMLNDKFDLKAKVIETTPQLKNLFLIQLESFPNEFVQDPRFAPNLNRFSKQFEFIAPIQMEPYTTWSMAATSVLQTGIPQIFPDPNWHNLANQHDFEYILGIQGISNILHSINYTLDYATMGINGLMGFNEWLYDHHYNRVYTAPTDIYLYDYMAYKYLPMLDNRSRNSNFKNLTLTMIVNVQTHSPYGRPVWCTYKNNLPFIFKCFYCCDHGVNKIIEKFLELKMYEHTLMVIFPDHGPYNLKEKELFILFPGIEKVDPANRIKDITYYDFAPTILDMIGIKKYQPEFPFGRNIYLNSTDHSKYCINLKCIQKHEKPDLDDLAIMYKFLHYERGKNIKPKYNLSNPFMCRINDTDQVYYSEKPCMTNIRTGNL